MHERAQLPPRTEVLIVGAGPVGLTLAASLATDSVPAVLVDKEPEGANTSRACVVHSRTLEVLRELKVSEDLVSRGLIVPRLRRQIRIRGTRVMLGPWAVGLGCTRFDALRPDGRLGMDEHWGTARPARRHR